jgi:hypothetical protein
MPRVRLLAPFFGFFFLAGCGGPEKELPRVDALPTDRGTESEVETTAPVPTESQPEAQKLVARCLALVTDGHPERLEKAKINRVFEVGKLLWLDKRYVAATRKIAAVWPDRFFFSNEFVDEGQPIKLSFGLRQNTLTVLRNDEPYAGFSKQQEQNLHVESMGLHWMPTLVPLIDPKTIVFGAVKQSLGTQTWDTVQVSISRCPIYTLWFKDKTLQLEYVTFLHTEGTSNLQKKLTVADFKPQEGILLPMRFEYERNGINVDSWSVSTWEFPDKIDDSVFDQTGKK